MALWSSSAWRIIIGVLIFSKLSKEKNEIRILQQIFIFNITLAYYSNHISTHIVKYILITLVKQCHILLISWKDHNVVFKWIEKEELNVWEFPIKLERKKERGTKQINDLNLIIISFIMIIILCGSSM